MNMFIEAWVDYKKNGGYEGIKAFSKRWNELKKEARVGMNDPNLLDELAKCQLCGSKNDLKALTYATNVKNLPVMEVRIICSRCFDKVESKKEAVS